MPQKRKSSTRPSMLVSSNARSNKLDSPGTKMSVSYHVVIVALCRLLSCLRDRGTGAATSSTAGHPRTAASLNCRHSQISLRSNFHRPSSLLFLSFALLSAHTPHHPNFNSLIHLLLTISHLLSIFFFSSTHFFAHFLLLTFFLRRLFFRNFFVSVSNFFCFIFWHSILIVSVNAISWISCKNQTDRFCCFTFVRYREIFIVILILSKCRDYESDANRLDIASYTFTINK